MPPYRNLFYWWWKAKFGQVDYHSYLNSHAWKWRRNRALKYAGGKCQLCNDSMRILHGHHRSYQNLGHEKQNDLIILCDRCHGWFHGRDEK